LKIYEPLTVLPENIQFDFLAQLHQAYATEAGMFSLVDIKTTPGQGSMGQRISVLALDENGFPIPNVRIAFSFDTASQFILEQNYQWIPPYPHQAFLVYTNGGGMCDMVLGPEGVIRAGRPGGVTVYALEPEYSSDVVAGCGMLADHTGMFLTFQLRRAGVQPLGQRLALMEERLATLESAVNAFV